MADRRRAKQSVTPALEPRVTESPARQWKIGLTPTAQSMYESITDLRTREKLRVRIDGLAKDPEKQGKPLLGELSGYRSLRAAGQRYRIVYKVESEQIIVLIVAVGRRKAGDKSDIYSLTQKLLRLGLIE
ncbi:MAG TPA: type II toxin-antitoxin system RelE/ParE family toxin [Abditibacteriaceae bacterium]|jgi:mRNA interferase RelE/StbE